MGYRIEDKEISLSGREGLLKIDSGQSGTVYKYKNSAVKIFRDNKEAPMEQTMARYLTTVPTERILLPRKLVFYNNAFRGYTMKLIPKKGTTRKIINTPKYEVLEGIMRLEEDTETISDRHILLSNTTPENTIFNGRLYLSNPDSYSILELQSAEELEGINKYQVYLLLVELVIAELKKSNFSPTAIKRVKEVLSLKDTDQEISDFFEDLMRGQQTIKQMVKKII